MASRREVLAGLASSCAGLSPAWAADDEIRRAFAPKGRLRTAINFGNTVLANRDASGRPSGISVDLATALGARLGLPVEFVLFDTAGKVSGTAGQDVWDIAFLAVDPVRAREITFTAPYVVIEGTYAVRDASPLRAIGDFDREGLRIAVGRGSAYDLFLTRALTRATLVRAETSQAAIRLFVAENLEAVGGVRQALAAFAEATPGYRLIPGRFTAIEQAMGMPAGRDRAAPVLAAFVEEMKASGFVAEALRRHNQPEAAVAPPSAG